MSQKQQVRAAFRRGTFTRDKYRCVVCGKAGKDRQGGDGHVKFHGDGAELVPLDAHHIEPRENMPFGGYVPENGVTLCDDDCHMKAEDYLKTGTGDEEYSPAKLYERIKSSREKAIKAAEATAHHS
ncbi:hypothetical protein R5W24_001813 [Gemmata sp. JC717]|uniref:HNH endonuclease n=1 Tax=Gemmata algarum TaxID=2975278 RepID=UPI0021BB9F05|nr:hypothetical protein [Gemmata algarum]MDY3552725.1 hypothetical protein [Gemmata algarum]